MAPAKIITAHACVVIKALNALTRIGACHIHTAQIYVAQFACETRLTYARKFPVYAKRRHTRGIIHAVEASACGSILFTELTFESKLAFAIVLFQIEFVSSVCYCFRFAHRIVRTFVVQTTQVFFHPQVGIELKLFFFFNLNLKKIFIYPGFFKFSYHFYSHKIEGLSQDTRKREKN